jgi:hypothetical protein
MCNICMLRALYVCYAALCVCYAALYVYLLLCLLCRTLCLLTFMFTMAHSMSAMTHFMSTMPHFISTYFYVYCAAWCAPGSRGFLSAGFDQHRFAPRETGCPSHAAGHGTVIESSLVPRNNPAKWVPRPITPLWYLEWSIRVPQTTRFGTEIHVYW